MRPRQRPARHVRDSWSRASGSDRMQVHRGGHRVTRDVRPRGRPGPVDAWARLSRTAATVKGTLVAKLLELVFFQRLYTMRRARRSARVFRYMSAFDAGALVRTPQASRPSRARMTPLLPPLQPHPFPIILLLLSGVYALSVWFSFGVARIELKYGCCIARTAEMRLAGSYTSIC